MSLKILDALINLASPSLSTNTFPLVWLITLITDHLVTMCLVHSRVSDPFYFDADPDPRIRIVKIWIRIRSCKGNLKFVSPQTCKVKIL